MEYFDFINQKSVVIENSGFEPEISRNYLFPFQSDVTAWAVKKGKAAIWSGCGTGKTRMQLSWAEQVTRHTGGKVLILAPLAVSSQTILEGAEIDIEVSRVGGGVHHITNYEQIHNIDPSEYSGVVLDESSILKNFAGKFKNQIIEAFRQTPYKLCCSATPSPNDYTEIGNHAEFLDICTRSEMLSTYFVHDSGETQKWRLKGHAEMAFFEWLSEWAVMFEKPSDIGYSDDGFDLPNLEYHQHIIQVDADCGYLFPKPANTLAERRQARKESIDQRCRFAADLSAGSDEPWLYWCDLNDESRMLSEMVERSIEVSGPHKDHIKENRMIGFSMGEYQKLVTKPKIAQFGMNWQHCNNMVFVGLSDSFEAMYQAVRRCWRFGQKKPVNVHIVISEKEGNVLANIQEKERKAKEMLSKMIFCMSDFTKKKIGNAPGQKIEYKTKIKMEVPEWMLSTKRAEKTGQSFKATA